MKLKFVPMLTGAIALAFAAAPLVVKAAPAAPGRLLLAQEMPRAGRGPMGRLNLTQDQKSQMMRIQQQTRQQIEGVLTPDQLQQYKAAMQNHQHGMQDGLNSAPRSHGGRHNPFANLNLSQDQKNQIQHITKSSREQMNSVLTDTQRQQLEQMRQSRQEQSQPGN